MSYKKVHQVYHTKAEVGAMFDGTENPKLSWRKFMRLFSDDEKLLNAFHTRRTYLLPSEYQHVMTLI